MLIEDLKFITKVAEFRSITAAATHLDMRTATASAALKRVEQALGSELFIRTTRQLKLSPAGERFLPKCQESLKLLEQAKQNIFDESEQIDSELRISVSSDLGRNLLMPWLDDFMDLHPKVKVKLNVSDSLVDFYRDPVDMALRYGEPNESNLYGFEICRVPSLLCGAPDYIEKHGEPKRPEDLSSHNGLFYQIYDKTHDTWEFYYGEEKVKVKMKGNRASNDGDLVRKWCVSGKGLALKSSLDMSRELLSGEVVSVMPQYQPVTNELWMVFPSRQSITPAARLLRDFLKQKTAEVLKRLTSKNLIDF